MSRPRLLRLSLFLAATVAVPLAVRADIVVPGSVWENAPVHLGPGGTTLHQGDGLDSSANNSLVITTRPPQAPGVAVWQWAGCPASAQTPCQISTTVGGPCSSTVNSTSSKPVCIAILEQVYNTHVPMLVVPTPVINGVTLSDVGLTSRLELVLTQGTLPATPMAALEQASALEVLDGLLLREGRQDGSAPSSQALARFVDYEVSEYEKADAAHRAAMVPSGQEPRAYFSTPAALDTFRDILTTDAERAKVVGASKAHFPTLATWMHTVLPRYDVAVGGLPTFDLAAAVAAI
jgi:hypothetical protein